MSVNVPHGITYFANNQRLPVRRILVARAPTVNDYRGFNLMDEWEDTASNQWYKLLSVAANVAQWVLQSSGSGSIEQVDADTGFAVPVAGVINLNGGTGTSTTASGNTIIINTVGGGFKWTVVTAATQQIVAGNAYFANNAGTLVFTLPASSVVGDSFRISGMLGNWQISQNTGQNIRVGNITTTTTSGSITSTQLGDSIFVVCSVANAGWQMVDGNVGSLIIA